VLLPVDTFAGGGVGSSDSLETTFVDSSGCFTFLWENDAFTFARTDGHYSNGMRLSYVTGEDRVGGLLASTGRLLRMGSGDGHLRASLAVGQSLFTPEDISNPDPIPDDRPYAAWLYGSLGLVADNRRGVTMLALSLGMVGPSAGGEEAQKWVHDLIGSPEPLGWANQLQDEFTVQFSFWRLWRPLPRPEASAKGGRITTEILPHVETELGNVFVSGAGGGTFRIGSNLPADYGPPRIQPAVPGSEFFIPSRGLAWYFFAGVEGRVVLHNLFLDGNTFQESLSVDRNVLVGDVQAGLALTLGRARGAFTYVIRSKEFSTQNRADQFGAVSLSFRF
jgi:hypothetical protein